MNATPRRVVAGVFQPRTGKSDGSTMPASISKENTAPNDVSSAATSSGSLATTPSRKAALLSGGAQRVLVPTKTPAKTPGKNVPKGHFMTTTEAYRNGCYPTPRKDKEDAHTSVTAVNTSSSMSTTPGRVCHTVAAAVTSATKAAAGSPLAPRQATALVKQSPPTRSGVPSSATKPHGRALQPSITTKRSPGPLATGLSDTVNSDGSDKAASPSIGDKGAESKQGAAHGSPAFAPPPSLSHGPGKTRMPATLSSNSRAAHAHHSQSSSNKPSQVMMRTHSAHHAHAASRTPKHANRKQQLTLNQANPQALRHSCSFGSELSSVLNDGVSIGSIELGETWGDHSLSLSVSVSADQDAVVKAAHARVKANADAAIGAERRKASSGSGSGSSSSSSSSSTLASKLARAGALSSAGGVRPRRPVPLRPTRQAFTDLDAVPAASGADPTAAAFLSEAGAECSSSISLLHAPVPAGLASPTLSSFAVPRFASLDRQGSGSSIQSVQSLSTILHDDPSPHSVEGGVWRASVNSIASYGSPRGLRSAVSSSTILSGSIASLSADVNQAFCEDSGVSCDPRASTASASLSVSLSERSPRHSTSPTEGQYQQNKPSSSGLASSDQASQAQAEQLSAIFQSSTTSFNAVDLTGNDASAVVSASVTTSVSVSLLDRATLMDSTHDLGSHIFRQSSIDSASSQLQLQSQSQSLLQGSLLQGSYTSLPYASLSLGGEGRAQPQSPTQQSEQSDALDSLPDSSLSLTLPYRERDTADRSESLSALLIYDDESPGRLVEPGDLEAEAQGAREDECDGEDVDAEAEAERAQEEEEEDENDDGEADPSVCSLEISNWRLHSNNDSLDSTVSLTASIKAHQSSQANQTQQSLPSPSSRANRAHVRAMAARRQETRDPVAKTLTAPLSLTSDSALLFVPVFEGDGGGI